jgi:hypothetical protein
MPNIIKIIELYSNLSNSFAKIFLDYLIFNYSDKRFIVGNGNIKIADISFQYKPGLPFIFRNFIDGQNIKIDVTQESLRNSISYIPQDPMLFDRTLGENIL